MLLQLLAAGNFTASAQPTEQLPVLLLNTRNGLQENKVRDITPLPDGRMCVFSPTSIKYFDGKRFYEQSMLLSPTYPLKNNNTYRYQAKDSHQIHWCKEKQKLRGFDLNSMTIIDDVGKKLRSWDIRDSIADFFVDNKGTIWALTTDSTLYYHSASLSTKAVAKGMSNDITAIASVNRRAFLCHFNGQVEEFDMTTGRKINQTQSIQPDLADSLKTFTKSCISGNMLWILRQYTKPKRSFVVGMEINTHRWTRYIPLQEAMYDLDFTSDGQLLISGNKHLYRYHPASETLTDLMMTESYQTGAEKTISDDICCLTIDDEGGWWMGLRNKGLVYYNPDRMSLFSISNMTFPFKKRMPLFYDTETQECAQQIAPNNTICTLRDTRSYIYIGTHEGLIIIHPEHTFTLHLTEEDGLSDRRIMSLAETEDGDIWVVSSHGISCMRPIGNNSWKLRTFGPTEGLLTDGSEFQNRQILQQGDSLIVGDSDGTFAFQPSKLLETNGYWHEVRFAETVAQSTGKGMKDGWKWAVLAMIIAVCAAVLFFLFYHKNKRKTEKTERIQDTPSPVPYEAETPPTADKLFMQKLSKTVMENLSDEGLNVQRLSRLMAMDRTVLYRRLQALTSTTPSAYIMHIRMQTARQLLEECKYPVAEVARRVGFSNSKYFSQVFKKTFGITPQQVKK
mgnify:FL=1